MNILVLGGTRFFGKHLVQQLLDDGHTVTIGTRGQSGNPFGDRVTHITLDRHHNDDVIRTLQQDFDVVYDNICYTPLQAQMLCDGLKGKDVKLIFTSTMATYERDGYIKKEEDFDPVGYPYELEPKEPVNYGEGKRQAEAVLAKEATFPYVAVRFPIVMGEDDYTKRTLFYVEHIAAEKPFALQNPEAEMSFITSKEAGAFLAWLATTDVEGAINATADGTISMRNLMTIIEEETEKMAKIVREAEEVSPYDYDTSIYMDNTKAKALGFTFSQLDDFVRPLIQYFVKA